MRRSVSRSGPLRQRQGTPYPACASRIPLLSVDGKYLQSGEALVQVNWQDVTDSSPVTHP